MNLNENARSLAAHKEWYSKVMLPYISKELTSDGVRKDESYEISCPFCMGLTEEYIESGKTKIMIIGQAARALGYWSKHWKDKSADVDNLYNDADDSKDGYYPPKRMQKWANEYLTIQLSGHGTQKINYNRSAFWAFFRQLKKRNDASLCWDDIDKVHFICSSDNKSEKALKYKDEVYLSAKYGDDKLSLLQREIEIANPDAVIFAIGPTYALSADVALGISGFDYTNMQEKRLSKRSAEVSKLFKDYPNKNNCVVQNEDMQNAVRKLLRREDAAVLWTYHPSALKRLKLLDEAVDKISEIISKR